MTHDEALRILLPHGLDDDASTAGEQREEAETHVLGCVDCWNAVHTVYRLVTGETLPDAAAMQALYGCEAIRSRLALVLDIPLQDISHRAPEIAAHLERCEPCREQLVDLLAFAGGDHVQAAVQAHPRWMTRTAEQGDRVLEVVGEFVVRVWRGAASLVEWPGGMEPVPVGVMTPALRAADQTTQLPQGYEALGRRFEFALDDTDVVVQLVIEPHPEGARLTFIVMRRDRPIAVTLRRIDDDGEYLVGRKSTADAEDFVAPQLRPGRYCLEVRERQTAVRYRIGLKVKQND